jgi:hypothetical protein
MNPAKVFISYAHEDRGFRSELEKHLKALERDGSIASWSDIKLVAGEEWDKSIKRELEEANIILFLVSSDFIASDYCYDVEVKNALVRHEKREAVVIPVIIRPCLWQGAPFAKFQATPIDTSGLEPITKWQNLDDAWYHVVLDIKEAARRLREVESEEKIIKKTEPLSFKFNNYARYKGVIEGEDRWDWMVFVDEPFEKIELIDNVEYRLHSTFPNPHRKIEDMASKFALQSNGWGVFEIFIALNLKDGSTIATSYDLTFKKSWPS